MAIAAQVLQLVPSVLEFDDHSVLIKDCVMDLSSNSCVDGLIQDHVDESINFWQFETDNPIHLQEQLIPPHPVELPDQPAASRELILFDNEDPRLEPFLGMLFDSGEAAKTFYIAYAGRVGFSVRIARSRRSKCYETVIMLRFVCSREGFCREKPIVDGKKTRKRASSVREGCRAMLEVVRRTGDEKWVVTKLVKEHNHEVGLPSKVHYVVTEGAPEFEPYLGMEFESLELAKMFYYSYASRVGFEARVRQSRRSLHDESLKMLKLVCSKHRYHSGRDANTDPGNQGLFSEGCEALFEVVRKDGERWVISKLVLEHSHELSPCHSKVHCVRSQGEVLVISKNFADTRNALLNRQDFQNYPREIRYNDLGMEDARNLLEYLKKRQAKTPAFYYAVQLENDKFMTNIFWVDAKARMAYGYFGDVVTFDTTYKKNKDLMPVVTFRGVNHHLQPVVFGCAFLVDESEASFVWLFENWLAAMSGRHPDSLVTDIDMVIVKAAAKVFPDTHHSFCKKNVLSSIHKVLPGLFTVNSTFEVDLKGCVDHSETAESFELSWNSIIEKYDLQGHEYLSSLYDVRYKWVPVYLRNTFIADISALETSEQFDKLVGKYFSTKASLPVAVKQFGRALASRLEKEAQADFVTAFSKPILKTASPIEKQAADIYTRAIFNRFQQEFVESLGYHVDKIEDGEISRYQVVRSVDPHSPFTVTFNAPENKALCSCCMFESSGILCRHVLRVFIILGVRMIPKAYILKRWTRNAKCVAASDDYCVEIRADCEEPSTARYNDLCRDGIRCAREGATSMESYRVAKDALAKAIAEVASGKQMREQLNLQSFIRSQRKHKNKVGKTTPKEESMGKKARMSYGQPLSEEYIT